MIELPEALTLANQYRTAVVGKVISGVLPPSSPHKFCWYNGDPADYQLTMAGRTVTGGEGFGIFAELQLDGGVKLVINDGVNVRLLAPGAPRPAKYQLLVDFTDGYALVFSVAMYGGIICCKNYDDNGYYMASKNSVSPLTEVFHAAYFEGLLRSVKPVMSAKAFLATEQRIPGLGNGVLQDILFQAGIHPKRKVNTLSSGDTERLYRSVKETLADMAAKGGRDTEKDLFGNPGGYRTLLSKNTLASPCPRCGGALVKETYLGGSVYDCPVCQPLI